MCNQGQQQHHINNFDTNYSTRSLPQLLSAGKGGARQHNLSRGEAVWARLDAATTAHRHLRPHEGRVP